MIFLNTKKAAHDRAIERSRMATNAQGLSSMGSDTFIPYTLAISVGTCRMMVMLVMRFIIKFRLLDMMEPNASIEPVRMLL